MLQGRSFPHCTVVPGSACKVVMYGVIRRSACEACSVRGLPSPAKQLVRAEMRVIDRYVPS